MFIPKFSTNLFSERNFKKNEVIKNEGDICKQIGIILKGEISITNITYDNKEFIIQSLSEGDMFGENLIFLNNNSFPGNVICTQNAKILFITKEDFCCLLKNNSEFLSYFLSYTSNKLYNMQNRLKILCQPTIKDKLLFYLENEMHRNNQSFVYIKSQTVLAQYLNIPRASLSRTISLMIKNKIIKKNKKIYTIILN